jgi:eukaryotic-like serine/threonine-protein kinase
MTPPNDPLSWAACIGALVAIAAYVMLWLPRATAQVAWIGSTALLLVGLAGAMWVPWLVLPATALLFGHLGWWRGVRPVRERPALPRRSAPAPVAPAPVVPAAAPEPAAVAAAESGLSVPDRSVLGRYRIEALLGRGAMGAVYLGRDPKIGRQVAIKTMALTQEFEGEALTEARDRFFREAETAGRLQHPGIVTIFDAGEDQGLAFIAMEYLRGHDLQRYTQPSRLLAVPDALNVVARVADALAYAHSQGVVHRDIKPANVMVDPATDAVKVTDFGIARIADNSRTRTGLVLGTPSFMSPEQMAGRRVDGRSDLYSLGVMLFQLLTGALPFRSESMAKLMFQIANEPAPDVRTLRPELPEAVANVVALALEKRPEIRYAEGQQFAADLRMLVEAIGTEPPAPVDPPAAATTPQADPFAATVKFSRPDPMHNSSP